MAFSIPYTGDPLSWNVLPLNQLVVRKIRCRGGSLVELNSHRLTQLIWTGHAHKVFAGWHAHGNKRRKRRCSDGFTRLIQQLDDGWGLTHYGQYHGLPGFVNAARQLPSAQDRKAQCDGKK
ncbi:MAG: hypothetical protein KDA71_03710, partial [Planctomycetales bacterium]|nr:hypothetical protein [Planctomycetales bacterium]